MSYEPKPSKWTCYICGETDTVDGPNTARKAFTAHWIDHHEKDTP